MHSTAVPATDGIFRLARETILVPIDDGSARLLDLAGQTYALTPIAAEMLRRVLRAGTATAAREIADSWSVPLARVTRDLDAFVDELQRRRLLLRGAAGERGPSLRQRTLSPLISLALRACRRDADYARRARRMVALAHLSFQAIGWSRTVALWQKRFPPGSTGIARERIDECVRQAIARSALARACKEQGLIAWALAREAGLSPRLVVAIGITPLAAHCWAEIDSRILADDRDRCVEYRRIRTYA